MVVHEEHAPFAVPEQVELQLEHPVDLEVPVQFVEHPEEQSDAQDEHPDEVDDVLQLVEQPEHPDDVELFAQEF